MSDLEDILLLNRVFAGFSRRPAALVLENVSPREILERIAAENLFGKGEALSAARDFSAVRELEKCAAQNIRCLALTDPGYPAILREIADPPLILYIRGHFEITDAAAVAVVGSRHPSFYGLMQARRFGEGLARAGITVLSGLAKGIDQAAHEGALKVGFGRTAAVLGSGLDVVYPPSAKKIFAEIAERGAVISEYPLGTPPLAHNFPTRNRIIAGLSLGVLVVEAHLRSGSLITAREALEQGREVFAIPGPVDQLTSRGTHRLIREGAALAESPEDIIEILAPVLRSFVPRTVLNENTPRLNPPSRQRGEAGGGLSEINNETNDETVKILEMLAAGPQALTGLTAEGRLSPGTAAGLMTRLEITGRVRRAPDGRFCLTAAG